MRKPLAAFLAILALIGQSAGDTTSAYQDSFYTIWSFDVSGEARNIKVVDLTGDDIPEVVSDSYFISSYGKSGTLFGIDTEGNRIWKYNAGLLEDSHTTDNGITMAGAGPYAEFVGPQGVAIWKRSSRLSPTQKIFSQTVWAGDMTGDELDDVIIGTNFGKKGSVVMVKDNRGEEMGRFTLKSTQSPYVLIGADTDADGKSEVIIGTIKYSVNTMAGTMEPSITQPASLLVYSAQGTKIWSDEQESAVTHLSTCDLDDDGDQELLVGLLGTLKAYNGDGSLVWTASVDGAVNDIDCRDLDGVGTVDLAVAAAKVYVMDSSGKEKWRYTSGTANAVRIHDLGGDGKAEVTFYVA